MIFKTETDKFVRKLLNLPEKSKLLDPTLDYSSIAVSGNELHYDGKLIRNDLSERDAEKLRVILGEKYRFRCPHASQFECRYYLKHIGLSNEQADEAIKMNFDKRQDYVEDIINSREYSFYESSKTPIIIYSDLEHISCEAAAKWCEILKAFRAEGGDAMSPMQKIENLLHLDNFEEDAELAEKAINNAIKNGWLDKKE